MSEIKTHSKLGASGATRWFNCPGSVALCEQMPIKEDTSFSMEGTLAHSLMEQVLKNPPANTNFYIGREDEYKLRTPKMKEQGLKIDQAMADHVQEFVDKVRFLFHSLEGAELHIEKKFHLKHIHPDLYGTCDVAIVQPFGEVHIVDFKYGAGVPVEVYESKQLLYYGLGAVHGEDYSKIVLHIHQPRCDHKDGTWRSWETTPKFMVEFSKVLKQKALETQKKDAPLNEGEWCRWCAASAVCPKLYKKAVAVAQSDFAVETNPKLPDVTKLNDEQIVRVIEFKKTITAWLDSVEEHALHRMMTGDKFTGLKLVKGRSRREWNNEDEVAQSFGDKVFKTSMLTVAAAEKVLGKDAIKPFVVTIEGGLQLAHETDKRKAIANAKDDFGKIELSTEDF